MCIRFMKRDNMAYTKELLTIEFRYHDSPHDWQTEYRTKTLTIGIYDTLEDAITEGNKALGVLSKSFEVRPDDKFKIKHLFGLPLRLVTNVCYPTKGVQYFAKITKLEFAGLPDVIEETFKAYDRNKAYKLKEEED